VRARSGGVTLKLYGHIHFYRRLDQNSVVSGNSGAPLNGAGSTYGFLMVEQRADGNVDVSEYEIGMPAMLRDRFTITPAGAAP
jgi:hypothetical protein